MSLIIDTSQAAPSERFDLWVEEASKAYFPMSFERGGGSAFSGRAHNCELGPVDVHRVTAGPSGLLRTRRTIDAADPETFHLGLELRGHSRMEQDGRSCTMPTGTLFGFQSSRPFVIRNETDFEMLVISFPVALLGQFAGRVCARTGERIDQTFASRFVAPFLIDLAARIEDDSLAAGGANLGETIVDVVRSIFLRQDEGTGHVPARRRAAPAGDDLRVPPSRGPGSHAGAHSGRPLHLHPIAASPLGVARGEHLWMDPGGPAGALPPGPR